MAVAERVSAGEHFASFSGSFLQHSKGDFAGSAFELEDWEKEWADEALELDPKTGQRIYRRAGLVIPRKNGKTTLGSALGLYCAGPADGEPSPHVILAAPSKENAGELFKQCAEFISHPAYGSPELSSLYVVQQQAITCPSVGGVIKRVSSDGNTNHGLNPHVVLIDELHGFRTPKQMELWRALTTAQGARRDPLVLFLTTAGEDYRRSLLGRLLERVKKSPDVEVEQRRRGLTIYRSRSRRLLIFVYAIKQGTPLEDLDEWKSANPANHRSKERIAEDLADELVDEATKRRLYGNEWSESPDRWLSDDKIEAARSELEPPKGAKVALSVDVGLYHDTTSVNLCWKVPLEPEELLEASDEGEKGEGGEKGEDEPRERVVHRAFTFSADRRSAAHEYHDGEIDFEEIEEKILELRKLYKVQALAYDPRFFADTAQRLKKRGLRVAEFTQGGPVWYDATQRFFEDFQQGRVLLPLPPDEVFEAHISAAAATKTDRGWKISKIRSEKEEGDGGEGTRPVIDALASAVMGHWTALQSKSSPYNERSLFSV